jgi:hypothetical protein
MTSDSENQAHLVSRWPLTITHGGKIMATTIPGSGHTLEMNKLSDIIDVGGNLHHLVGREDGSVEVNFEFTASIDHLPAAVHHLDACKKNASWLVFMFMTEVWSDITADSCVNLQFSIEADRLGLDWILLGERNIADKTKIMGFIRRKGHHIRLRKMNGVSYLRVEGRALAELGRHIAEELYGVTRDTPIGLLASGVSPPREWLPRRSNTSSQIQ